MEITPQQSRAARGLLNWTQDKLAVKVGVAVKTVRDFESGKRQPMPIVRSSIKQALEQAGVEFLDGNGVRLRS